MNIRNYIKNSSLLILIILLTGCANGQFGKKSKPFKHNTPLIKTDMRTTGKSEISKTLEMGPKPVVGKMKKQKSKGSRLVLLTLKLMRKLKNMKMK